MKARYTLLLFLYALLAQGQITVGNGLTHQITTPPGGTIRVPITLHNHSDQVRYVQLYWSDYSVQCDSGYKYTPPGTSPQSCTPWMSIPQTAIALQPHDHTTLYVNIAVPANLSLPSAHGCLFVHNRQSTKPLPEHQKELGIEVRYAIRFLYNNPNISHNIVLQPQNLAWDPTASQATLQLYNAGLMHRNFTAKIQLLDHNGKPLYVHTAKPKNIQPGQCRTLRFTDLPKTANPAHLIITAQTPEGERFGFTKTLTAP